MRQIAVLSSDDNLNKRITSLLRRAAPDYCPATMDDGRKFLEFLNYELPELSICNLSDPEINAEAVLEEIKADPWLHYGGIVGVHERDNERELEQSLKGSNVVSLIHMNRFDFELPRAVRIIDQNRQIVFQRDLQSQLLAAVSGSFEMDNDPFDCKTYTNLIINFLFNASFIGRDAKDQLTVALMELFINAIEHGNCRISHEEKSAWLEAGRNIFDLMRKKNEDPAIRSKKVHFRYRITPQRSVFAIRDDGEGFDWRKRVREINDENYLKLHGRGIIMAEHYLKRLTYNAKGNEVRFEIDHQVDESNAVPRAFESQDEVVFRPGQTVFSQGEASDFLYYIVSGKFAIVSEGKVISELTPADVFLGEMSFLLNNQRSATVKSVGRGVLLKISKAAFVNAIKASPHYGIFLARMIAQRLARLNERFSKGGATPTS
jgi:anti-sigma regulatory factor (Ser/Thr protein kinase)